MEAEAMSLFSVDQQKCNRDKICVQACPVGIIAWSEEKQLPMPTKDAESVCIKCGHCVAVCPTAAFSHQAMTPDQCVPIERDIHPSAEQAVQFLLSRRSIRVYQNKSANKETLAKLADVARCAPSGINTQPTEWLIIEDSAEVNRLAGCVIDWMRTMIEERPQYAAALRMERSVKAWENGFDSICRNAPHMFVAHARKDDPMATSSCPIALSHLELAAHAYGLGACWAGYFNMAANFSASMKKELALPEGHVSYGAMMIGYPKFHYYRIPLRKEARIIWR